MTFALSEKLREITRQRELQRKPFPVEYLLILYIHSHRRDTYINHFEGFKLLLDWLSPIQLTGHSEPIPSLYRTYELQELSKHLGTTQENLNHGYQTALTILQLSPYITLLPKKVPTLSDECASQ